MTQREGDRKLVVGDDLLGYSFFFFFFLMNSIVYRIREMKYHNVSFCSYGNLI